MSKKDTALKDYLSIPEVFADLFNGTLFRGEPKLTAEKLESLDSTSSVLQTDKEGKILPIHRHRDIIKKAAFGVEFVILGVENQEHIHYGMPVREMLYDSLTYQEQMDKLSRENKKEARLNPKEYLSGIRKSDRLVPVITLTVYYGKEPWDGCRSLHDMLELTGEQECLKEFIPDYKMNLLWARNVPELERYQTGLRELFGVLQHDSNKQELLNYVEVNQNRFDRMEERLFDVISVLSSTEELMAIKEKAKQEGGKVNMCKAIMEIKEEGRQEGRQEGEDQLATLLTRLQREGKMEDMLRCIQEKGYREKLLQQMQPEKEMRKESVKPKRNQDCR